jgi:hypothetical protein
MVSSATIARPEATRSWFDKLTTSGEISGHPELVEG